MHTRGSQLVPELLLKLSGTLHIQYRYTEHVHEEMSCKKKEIHIEHLHEEVLCQKINF